jgi:uncharacterized protein YodC (DUF2158 family)
MAGDRKWKTGDIVQLKSGSPPMTVKGYYDGKLVTCQWFAGKKSERDNFPEDSLEPAIAK